MSTADNIVLIGMPGAGKSTVGVVLAKIMGKDFIDADLVIQHTYGKTLQTMIDESGSERFIELEGDVLCNLQAENSIIATGGSAVYSDRAMQYLAKLGTVVYLEIDCESLLARLGDLDERGVVMRGNVQNLRELFEERRPLYERYADIVINTDGLDITTAARKVASALK